MSDPAYSGLAALLLTWLPEQRWFAAKDSGVESVQVVESTVLRDGDPALTHLVVRVGGPAGEHLYQLLLGFRSELAERLQYAEVGSLDGRRVYDALHDPELMEIVLRHILSDQTVQQLRFSAEPDVGTGLDPATGSRLVGVEQSNSSVIFGDAAILKFFRRLSYGTNPDLELHRALAHAGNPNIAQPYGAIETTLNGQSVTCAMLQEFIPNAGDGWQMAVASVRDLFAEGDLHADEVGGDFAGEAERLGTATAHVHVSLADSLGSTVAPAEDTEATIALMMRRLDDALAACPQLGAYEPALREAFEVLRNRTGSVPIQRVHGDYHLGQVIRALTRWVVLDFEGEPARPFAERVAPMSPLRDVAGMLRSFDYAARHLLVDAGDDPQLTYRAREWVERNSDAFCTGYAKVSGADPRADETLLAAFELDKAVYEVAYEARNRPTWLPIPLAAVARLTGSPALDADAAPESAMPDPKETDRA